jgi:hypothetical protein
VERNAEARGMCVFLLVDFVVDLIYTVIIIHVILSGTNAVLGVSVVEGSRPRRLNVIKRDPSTSFLTEYSSSLRSE